MVKINTIDKISITLTHVTGKILHFHFAIFYCTRRLLASVILISHFCKIVLLRIFVATLKIKFDTRIFIGL